MTQNVANRTIGTKMWQAMQLVEADPGCSKRSVARMMYPAGQERRGYVTINRCIKAGLMGNYGDSNRSYLRLTVAGSQALQAEKTRWAV